MRIKTYFIMTVACIALFIVGKTVGIERIEGNQAVVLQHLTKGVIEEVWLSGTKFYWGWELDPYKYDIGTQKITFAPKVNESAEYDRIKVNLGENGGQSAWISVSVNYRIGWETTESGSPKFSPHKLVSLHKDGLQKTYEDVILKRTIVEVINKVARPQKALSIYSGTGFVQFVEDVEVALKNHPVFEERGIFIENVIVYQVELDPKYEAEIEAKQFAIQNTLKKIEETKAAEEEARRVFAASQAEVEARTQKAEAQKIERIKSAEAEKREQVLKAEGQRDSDLAKASGILAVGKAEAEVDALKRESLYAGPSGAWRAKVEIATKQAEKLKGMFQGVQIVPEKTILKAGAIDNSGFAVSMDE